MKPRDFLNFFKTRSGKLLLFGVIFGGGLWLFSAVRNRTDRGTAVAVAPLGTNQSDKPQIVQTVATDAAVSPASTEARATAATAENQ